MSGSHPDVKRICPRMNRGLSITPYKTIRLQTYVGSSWKKGSAERIARRTSCRRYWGSAAATTYETAATGPAADVRAQFKIRVVLQKDICPLLRGQRWRLPLRVHRSFRYGCEVAGFAGSR